MEVSAEYFVTILRQGSFLSFSPLLIYLEKKDLDKVFVFICFQIFLLLTHFDSLSLTSIIIISYS